MVAAGQVVAMMDTKDLQATLKKSEAMANLAQRALDEAKANLVQTQTQLTLAQQELDHFAVCWRSVWQRSVRGSHVQEHRARH
jgi:HlyD family secretion protein